MTDANLQAADAFIAKWKGVAASELSTSQSFLIDLCELLEVPRPHPTPEQDYMFERPLSFRHADGSSSAGRIDLYRRGAFVLESKKLKAGAHTRGFDEAILRAHSQAQNYVRALPAGEGRPPFVVVVDVGHRIELYSEFSRSGGNYVPFPDPRSHRIGLDDLRNPAIRQRLRKVWLEPLALDPSRESARVTRAIAAQLAELAKSLERSGHAADAVAQFLMRCLFTMFAEDVRLLPEQSFRNLLQQHRERADTAMRMLAQLWRDMDGGGFSAVLATDVLQFNGKLFKQPDTLPLDTAQIDLLIEAARADWRFVEPAIFGTLLERALSPGERHKLGAHYTPRAYVERLVLPTVIEPLRAEWSNTQAAALTLAAEDKPDEAVAELLKFHHRLCSVRVLDPACGSGNFLYVTLEHLKRLEGEVLGALDDLGHRQTGLALGGERADAQAGETVDPHNLLGIELNPRAAAIAEVVLWIGYLQWHFRTRGDVRPPVPVVRDFRNIENRDAVLAYDRVEVVTDANGVPVTRWDGETMKPSPVTGEQIPDESARKPIERYVNPRKAAWPAADFVVGNPPFIGNKRMRTALGDGYVEALRAAWDDMPESADFVMYWWHHAAQLTRQGMLQRFGFITTNSIRQAFNRRVLEPHLSDKKQPLSLVFAIPDHPWVDTADGAAVRIAMTVGAAGSQTGASLDVLAESEPEDGEVTCVFKSSRGLIHVDLRAGLALADAGGLNANEGLAYTGMYPLGQGFVVMPDDQSAAVGSDKDWQYVLRPFVIARDLTQKARRAKVIDFYPRDMETSRRLFPSLFQRVVDRVKPERDQNADRAIRENWWIHARPRPELRCAAEGLTRFILVPRTAKWFSFQFCDIGTVPDSSVVAIASEDALHLGVLSSSVHLAWAVAAGGRLGVGNDTRYQHQRTFNPFPFPDLNSVDKFGGPIAVSLVSPDGTPGRAETFGEYPSQRIAALAEQLDAHRKRQQAAHPELTLTGMYNVLEKLRGGETLTAKERTIHEQGLVSVLRQLHDELDEAVLHAYGWGDLLPLLRVAHGNEPPDSLQRLAEAERDLQERERRLHGGPATSREEAKRAFDDAILERLVALNAERAAEEARGHIRWLRPEFQNPQARSAEAPAPEQGRLDAGSDDAGDDTAAAAPIAGKPQPWPKDTVEQVRAVADLIAASPASLSIDEIAARFTARGPWKKRLPQLLDMLVALGRAELREDGSYGAGR